MQTEQTVRAFPIAIPATTPIERALLAPLVGSEVVSASTLAVVCVTTSVHMYNNNIMMMKELLERRESIIMAQDRVNLVPGLSIMRLNA